MLVAIVHDFLAVNGGAERFLKKLLKIFPEADLFSVVDFFPESLLGKKAKTTFVQNLPFAKKFYRFYLPLMPIAIEQLDVGAYDLVISNSYAVAKGVLTSHEQLHICYCHTPLRFLWDFQAEFLKEHRGFTGLMARWYFHRMRHWDVRSSNSVDYFVANSQFVAARIQKTYRREATVIYPPIAVDAFPFYAKKDDYYLTVSRLVAYKKIDLIVEAFAKMRDKKLLVIGEGQEMAKLRKKATPNVSILGHQSEEATREAYQKAKAFIYAAKDDFGIVPLEAQCCGTPVIAFGRGGNLETVRGLEDPEPTGCFFYEQTSDAIVEAVAHFEKESISPLHCRKNAERFSEERFRQEFLSFVNEKLS